MDCPKCGGNIEIDEYDDVWTIFGHCKECETCFIIRIEVEK